MDLFGDEGPCESCTELEVFAVEVLVDLVVEGRGVLAGQRVFGVVAGQRGLVKDCAETANEGPHAQLGNAFAVLEGVAQVEDLAVVVCVRIVTKSSLATIEAIADALVEDSGGIGWQLVEVR